MKTLILTCLVLGASLGAEEGGGKRHPIDAPISEAAAAEILDILRSNAKAGKSEDEEVTYLGVGVDALDPDLGKHLGLDQGVGLIVRQVVADSPAGKAGLEVDDILVKLDDQLLLLPEQLQLLVRRLESGTQATVTYHRGGKEATVEVTLAERTVTAAELARERARRLFRRGLEDVPAWPPQDRDYVPHFLRSRCPAVPEADQAEGPRAEGKVIWRGKPRVFIGGDHQGLSIEVKDGEIICKDQEGKLLWKQKLGTTGDAVSEPLPPNTAKRLQDMARAVEEKAAEARSRMKLRLNAEKTVTPDAAEEQDLRRELEAMKAQLAEMKAMLKALAEQER